MCGHHNIRASAGDNTGQNTGKGHTPNPRTEIKIHDPSGNRTRAARLEDRDSTATATNVITLVYYIGALPVGLRVLMQLMGSKLLCPHIDFSFIMP